MSLEYNYSNNFEENMNEEREKLIEELYNIKDIWDKDELTGKTYEQRIADFIIEDRKIICAPLISLGKLKDNGESWKMIVINSVNETLKLAGLEDGK